MSTVVAALLLLAAPQESQIRLRAGQEKLKMRDFDGAIPEFKKSFELDPGQYNAHFGLGMCYWEKDEYGKARDQFAKVIELAEKEKPGAPLVGVRQKLLGCALQLEDFEAAIAVATRLIEIQATGEYYYARGLARQRKGDVKGALEDGASALSEDGRMTKARSLRASLLLSQGDAQAAMDELAAAIQAKPSDPTAYLARAAARYQQGQWAEAFDDLQKAEKLFTGQNSDLEGRAYAASLLTLVETRRNPRYPPIEPARAFVKAMKELKKSPSRNHLLMLPFYLSNEETEAGLLRAVEETPGRRVQARCEAWFFIGERKLLGGDKVGAREAFTKAVDTAAQGVFEHDLARARLRSLQNR